MTVTSLEAEVQTWFKTNERLNWLDWISFEQFLDNAYATSKVYPPRQSLFKSLSMTPLAAVKVVILGQDPYHGPDQAQGLSFSVAPDLPVPPSLKNIFKEQVTLGVKNGQHGCLDAWAKQGVLLLNSVLSVEAGAAGSHRGQGWEAITNGLLKKLSQEREAIVFLLWGRDAQQKAQWLDPKRHLILQAAHPSPFSAYRGFLGCGHFQATNAYLNQNSRGAIDWQLPIIS